uniref:SDR family oxidoreductase n=1 Tax=candidate division WOR-3 bacterium TaxID=2052148 RepID=A0A7C2K309_UNCW3
MLLKEKVSLITGGAKGIGKGIALKFSEEGSLCVIADVALDEAEKTVEEIKKRGGKAFFIPCDVTKIEDVKRTVEETIKKYEKIDILINNAGGMRTQPPPIEEISEEEWDLTIALNLKSQFLFCKFVVPIMKKRRYGKIINISSIGAVFPPAHCIHYNSAKAGVIGFTLDLAYALAPFNINVNAILPGPIKTFFYEPLRKFSDEKEREQFFNSLAKSEIPLQRIGTPEDIANAALFLASDLSSFITGALLPVAGGLPLKPFKF